MHFLFNTCTNYCQLISSNFPHEITVKYVSDNKDEGDGDAKKE